MNILKIGCMISIFFSLPVSGQDLGECGSLVNAYGPYDYSKKDDRELRLPIVESGHFNSDVENLIRGQSGYLIGDLDYTLRAFPNHPRALWSMARLHLREGKKLLGDGRYSIDCWFERGIYMNPEYPAVRYIYGMYQHKAGELDRALQNYKIALDLNDENAEVHYNLGLLYIELGNLEKAQEHAIDAYRLGFPLPGLRRKLLEAGVEMESQSR